MYKAWRLSLAGETPWRGSQGAGRDVKGAPRPYLHPSAGARVFYEASELFAEACVTWAQRLAGLDSSKGSLRSCFPVPTPASQARLNMPGQRPRVADNARLAADRSSGTSRSG